MSLKSNSELEKIILNKSKYTDEAIQAVIWELEKREIIQENEIERVPKNTVENTTKETFKIKEFKKDESAFDEFELPILYSKNAIKGFSIFFGVIFGAVLLMYNLKIMEKPKGRIHVFIFGILFTIVIYFIANTLSLPFFLSLVLNLFGASILTGLFWNKNLKKDLKYESKSITKPLIISLLIIGFIIFMAFLPFIIEV